jgi:hypothetical protein
MYATFNNQFYEKWNHPEDVEKLRKQEEEKYNNNIIKTNMEILENCIQYNAISKLDRTKSYDKTFICNNFISKSGRAYMHNEEIQQFAQDVKSQIKELGIEYTDNKTEDNEQQKMMEVIEL